MINGRFTIAINKESGNRRTLATSIEIPVIPPSMKWLESKNPLMPKAAEKIARTIRTQLASSLINFLSLELNVVERFDPLTALRLFPLAQCANSFFEVRGLAIKVVRAVVARGIAHVIQVISPSRVERRVD